MSGALVAGEAFGRAIPLVAGALGASGLAVAALPARIRMRTELRRRWRTWAIAAPVFLGALFLGAGGAFALAAGLGVIAVAEYVRLAGLSRADQAVLTAAAVVLPGLAWQAPSALDARTAGVLLLAAALPSLLSGDGASGFTRTARTAFGLLWIPLALTGLVTLGETAVAVGLAVALGDVGAWCGGTALGRRGPLARPLSPLSPNKTWAGVAGAALATGSVLLAVGAFSPGLWAAVLAGCVLGDLLESMVKREAGVKDAGDWLPGFGGLLDRIDSLLPALLLAAVVTA
ncbi:phosphatidate cytidylyltransferase [Streptomyces tsukubensis]|uniref:Phosphatidate cytidylyltransferase n=1 Tax=Streptomyces tsukubensis (strain DSM 42081 / NBRC 108919 / NRRL 18488 / 9993) TaxID=1114943 RepID=A0A7G3UAC5_STRT9|nr:phosphatidate cytidylyltransferase [Streptomyces tsukubensis]AZK96700.1 phosphatidate cytidylyltransferase [Streptomyces tsukubensis]QKM67306.1 phosphatidate cytidylyltransferase [Streptomyces tsukubensis NRRL18488]TAI42008.1 phosphatidate cytidylyltransferase [Streptomyces tsukubensis]